KPEPRSMQHSTKRTRRKRGTSEFNTAVFRAAVDRHSGIHALFTALRGIQGKVTKRHLYRLYRAKTADINETTARAFAETLVLPIGDLCQDLASKNATVPPPSRYLAQYIMRFKSRIDAAAGVVGRDPIV